MKRNDTMVDVWSFDSRTFELSSAKVSAAVLSDRTEWSGRAAIHTSKGRKVLGLNAWTTEKEARDASILAARGAVAHSRGRRTEICEIVRSHNESIEFLKAEEARVLAILAKMGEEP